MGTQTKNPNTAIGFVAAAIGLAVICTALMMPPEELKAETYTETQINQSVSIESHLSP